MVEAYNYYAGGFIPKVNPKTNVHNRRELKNKYKSIVALNNANPLAMISLSPETSNYALDVKSLSMELGEAVTDAMNSDQPGEALDTTLQLYNKLLTRSDEYGQLKNKPSRPGCELRKLVSECADELTANGIAVDETGFLSKKVDGLDSVPKDFLGKLKEKCEYMSMNPMEYVEKRVFSYAHLHRSDVGYAYAQSVYTGMFFNSYC